jgi:outer membrane lipoprotein SlyB
MSDTTQRTPLVTGLFNDRDSAERAYQSVESRGYSRDDVNLMMTDETRDRHFGEGTPDTELGSKALEGAGAGSAIGGTLGAIIGGIAAIGTNVLIPGLGLVVWGPIAAALTGAGAGGLTGGLIGALVGSGIPEEHATEYESGVKNGGIFMGVNARNDEDASYFQNEWGNHGSNVHAVGTGAGVIGGAATGAAIGTAVAPGIGTAAGGVVGGVAGAIAGGAAGHEIAEAVNPQPGDDRDGDHAIGTGGGAVGGAVTGAAIGTAVAPGPGTAVGGVIGAVGGAVGGHEIAEEVNPDDKVVDDDTNPIRNNRI